MWRTVKSLVIIILLLAVCVKIQMVGLPPVVTSLLLNAILFLVTLTIGIGGGVILGTLEPWFLLLMGFLSPVARSVMPFMIVANAAMVIVFGVLGDQSTWVSVVAASVCRCAVLMLLLTPTTVLSFNWIQSFQVSQFIGALLGGSLVVFACKNPRERYRMP